MLISLFVTFFKIGLFTFGGGYAMISQIKEYIVEKRKWIDEEELMQIITIAESTPGPIAINMATYIGFQKKKILGSLCATLGVVLPSFLIIFVISLFLHQFMEFQLVKYLFVGINCAVTFLILKTGLSLFKNIEKKIIPLFTFIIVFSLIIVFELIGFSFSSIYFIIIGGVVGIITYALLANQPKKEDK